MSARYITPEALFRLRFGDGPRPAWDVGVLSFRGQRGAQALVAELNARPLDRRAVYGLEPSLDRPVIYEAPLGDRRLVLVTHCLWGGPQTAILVEELAALGVRVIVGFGVAGALVEDLPQGTQVVAARGLVTDGTSRAYTSASETAPDSGLAELLAATAMQLQIAVAPVTIATVDALYRETPEAVGHWRDLGAQAINMETAPLYAAASMCDVRAIWVGHISDSLSSATDAWQSWARPADMTDVTVALTVGVLEQLVAL
jgi:uridine phosphorylase